MDWKSSKKLLAFLMISLYISSIVACSAKTSIPTATTMIVPSYTLTDDIATAFTPGPTNTPIPSFGKLPQGEATNYTLKPWSDQDVWNLISALPPEFPTGEDGRTYDSRTEWAKVQLLLLREILSRFPGTPSYSDAMTLMISPEIHDVLFGKEYTLELFRSTLEAAINTEITAGEDVTSEILNKIIADEIHQNDIQVYQVLPANNILKDGMPGWVLDTRIDGSYYGTAFVLAGEPASYRLVSPRDKWRIFMWSDQQVFTHDLNSNGIPEIAIWDSYWGTGMSHFCSEVLSLYEWDGNRFINLTPGLETNANTDTGYCLGFDIGKGPSGTQAITTGTIIHGGCSYGDYTGAGSLKVERRYEWNGSFFGLAREEVLPLEASMPDGAPINRCTLSWVNEAGAANDQAFHLLPKLMSSTDPIIAAEFADQFGPAYLDFFNFKLGTWYAMRGFRSQAMPLLLQVRDTPSNPKYTAASQLAEAFLQGYTSTNAYTGCVLAYKALDINSFKSDVSLNLDTLAMRKQWGFSDWQWANEGFSTLVSGPGGREDPLNICSLTNAFRLAAKAQNFKNTEHLTRWLDDQKIPYTGLKEGDVDGDGRNDWILLLGTGENQSLHLWVLLNKSKFALPLWVADIHRTTGNIPVAWGTFTPDPMGFPLNVYQWTDGMIVFRTVSQNNWIGIEKISKSIRYDTFFGFTVLPSINSGAEDSENTENLQVEIGEHSWEADWYTLGWDPAINTLRVVSSPQVEQDQKIQIAENLLFGKNDPKGALIILEELLYNWHNIIDMDAQKNDDLPVVQPYLQYLLGLAYEMSGDEQNAIISYWTLWHDFPLHPLSYVIQQKLGSNIR